MLTGPRTLLITLAASAVALADPQATRSLEQQWRDAAELAGELVELKAGDDSFVTIHRPHQRGDDSGAVILLHDRSTNANSLDIVRPLRLGLAEYGWETLSVQLPVLYPYAGDDAWMAMSERIGARLQATLAWFEQREQRRVVVLGVGDSALIALRFIADNKPPDVRSLVMLGIDSPFADDTDKEALGKLEITLLEVYAEHDRFAVLDTVAARKRAAREAELAIYHQRLIGASDDRYRGTEAQLVATVRTWLNTHAPTADDVPAQ